MDRDLLIMGLAAVFAGITVLLAVLGLSYQPFLLVLALPFGATTYFMWYQASGRLTDQARTRRVRREPSGFGAGARRENVRQNRRRARRGAGAGPGGRAGAGARTNGGARTGAPRTTPGPSRAEAYRALDLEPGASTAEVKRAYRSKVKEVHPDTETGDEESFKRVNRAYESLNE
ncbi:molecular chaperone DnaJ [Haloprofundus marisrubri]|uniref:Molecular chaperone DnaJ n=1 Tax=Haloprofundus marisrubri TaxID=1514971 RepID=A0A0W1R7G8_9EURY|nr:J domain-containing protein [Haloprofundus marisrubri]KTG09231.1 molecular chaperone DnaJ [Haloprofundus marisrubri]